MAKEKSFESAMIYLTKGKWAIVDADKWAIVDADMYDFLNKWKWFYTSGYAARHQHIGYFNGKKKTKRIYMHRAIMNTPDGMDTDHREPGHTLDNRRRNLRICTTSQNLRNSVSRRGSSSKYKGVSWDKRRNKWVAQISIEGRAINLGRFTLEEDAAQAYNFAAVEHFGEFSRLNHAA